MGEVVVFCGPETREKVRGASGPMLTPVDSGGGGPASQCERLGEVVQRVLQRLIVSDTNATTCLKSGG